MITTSDNLEITVRKYPKLLDHLAMMGGFIQTVLLFGFLLIYPYNKIDLIIKSGELQYIEPDKENIEKGGFIRKIKKILQFGFCDKFLVPFYFLLNKTRTKYKVFEEYQKSHEKRLDWWNYSRKFEEVNKLKKICLNIYQEKLLDFIKPDKNDLKPNHLHLDDLLLYIKEKEIKNNLSEIDKKIFEMLEFNIKEHYQTMTKNEITLTERPEKEIILVK